MITEKDTERFNACTLSALTAERKKRGIGTLGERKLHIILKNFFEPDTSKHEQKVSGYVADIKDGDRITEIQTRSFAKMRKKLADLSENHKINLVFPIAATKHIVWVNPESGELSERRKSPKTGKPWDILYEMYSLRPIMPMKNVTFTLVFCDMDEFRMLSPKNLTKKRGASRYERIPTELNDVITLKKPADYLNLIPPSLGTRFTAAEFAKAAKMTSGTAGKAVRTLVSLGIIEHTETVGRAYIYSVVSKSDNIEA